MDQSNPTSMKNGEMISPAEVCMTLIQNQASFTSKESIFAQSELFIPSLKG